MEKEITHIVFRKFKTTGEIICLFPFKIVNKNFDVLTLQENGEFGYADYNSVIDDSKNATDEELQPLFEKVREMGYKEIENEYKEMGTPKLIKIEKVLSE